MPLTLEEAEIDDFNELVACQNEAFTNPPQSFYNIFFPRPAPGPDALAEAVRGITARQLEWHQSDPTSYWQKIVDTETGKIAGGALWKICRTNPFEEQVHEGGEAYWHPEGSRREFMTQALGQFEGSRTTMMRRPHVYLNILFTHPNYRRQGAGDLIMNWGMQKADELGIEMWIDGTSVGVPVYVKHGFIAVHETVLEPQAENPDEEWEKVKAEFGHVRLTHFWRPMGGKLREGQEIPKSSRG